MHDSNHSENDVSGKRNCKYNKFTMKPVLEGPSNYRTIILATVRVLKTIRTRLNNYHSLLWRESYWTIDSVYKESHIRDNIDSGRYTNIYFLIRFVIVKYFTE